MNSSSELRTERLIFREWFDENLPQLAAINANPEVMRHFPFDSKNSNTNTHDTSRLRSPESAVTFLFVRGMREPF